MTAKKKPKPALTGSVRELIDGYIASDPAFREALIQEAVEAMLSGDVETGKTILRDYIKATDGFEKLGRAIGTPPKSLIRMFGPRGNPQARNLFGVLGYLQKRDGLTLRVGTSDPCVAPHDPDHPPDSCRAAGTTPVAGIDEIGRRTCLTTSRLPTASASSFLSAMMSSNAG